MTDEFLTQGLRNDRYLKAIRLTDQFESGIESRLRSVGERMVQVEPDLFVDGVDGSMAYGRSSGSTLAYMRVDYAMERVRDLDSEDRLTLNVHLYWCDPDQYNRPDVDGALRAFGYKIKNLSAEDEDHVRARTRDWDLHTAEDPYGSSTVFYEHVSSTEDVERTGDTLVEHFSTFGRGYGIGGED